MLGEIPEEVKEVMMSIIGSNALLLLLLLLIPLAVFFASAMLTASISAKSFKEAQSMISPMMIIIMIPSVIAFMPSMHLNLSNAWIPLLNVSLAAKDIIAGTIEPLPYLITFVSLILVAAGGMMLSLQFFKNERNVLS
jgi:sodium transport system permease protein